MQRLSNMATVLGRYSTTRIAISTFSGQERFDMSGLRGISNSVIGRVDNKQNVRVVAYLISTIVSIAEFCTTVAPNLASLRLFSVKISLVRF